MSKSQITTLENLKEAIQLLKEKESEDELMFQKQYDITHDRREPNKLLKGTFEEIAASTEIKSNLLSLSLSLSFGYFTKILFEKVSKSPFKKVFGTVIMLGITNILVKHPEVIGNLGGRLINLLKKKHDEHDEVIEIIPGESPFLHDPGY